MSIVKKRWLIIFILAFLCAVVSYFVWRVKRHKHREFTYDIKLHKPSVRGYMLMAVFEKKFDDASQLIIMDMQGKIYFRRKLDATVYDFRQWNLNGKIYYTYFIEDKKAYHIPNLQLHTGHLVMLDSGMREIKQVHLLAHDDITTEKHQDLDLHEFIMLSEHHYFIEAAYEKNVHNIPDSLKPSKDIKVATTIVQEIRNDSVVWQWDASKFSELYADSKRRDYNDASTTKDYMHPNAMYLDPRDSNLLLSFRDMDMVIKVSRQTGAILWKLGGPKSDFKMTDEQLFYGPHHITVTDDKESLLMLDNGDSVMRRSTRINEYKLDEINKTLTGFKTYTIPKTFATFMGSVQKKDNHYFVSSGVCQYVFDMDCTTTQKDFFMLTSLLSYRVYKVDSIYGLEKGLINN